MTALQKHSFNSLFANEHACVSYLFRRRWPFGFKCPFCGSVQKEIAPAYTVVCRYCRKQTSITAQTLMHGSKKSLVAWMQVAWHFCYRSEGLSARELQRLMGLSCYQTAWHWLQILRQAATLAEAMVCRGNVLVGIVRLSVLNAVGDSTPEIALALELNQRRTNTARAKFLLVEEPSPETLADAICRLVLRNTTLQLREEIWPCHAYLPDSYNCSKPTREQLQQGRTLIEEIQSWLAGVFRGAIEVSHLQGYLDEFSFHYNTAFWPDRPAVLDHLVTALVSTPVNISPADHRLRGGGGS